MPAQEGIAMPTDDGLPEVNDIVTSLLFAFANRSESGGFLKIVNATESPDYSVSLNREQEPKEKLLNRHAFAVDAFDSSRGHAEFIVEEARWADNPLTKNTDACSSRWYVSARRLRGNGSYDPNGERISFFLCGLLGEYVLAAKDVKIARTRRAQKSKTGKV